MKKIYLLNWGDNGGAPKMGHHLCQAFTELGYAIELICAEQLCKYEYILALSNNKRIYSQRESIIYEYFKNITPGWVIINSCKNSFAAAPLHKLGFKVIVYFHEGQSELESLGGGHFFYHDSLSYVDIRIHASLLSYNFVKNINFLTSHKPLDIILEPFSTLVADQIDISLANNQPTGTFDFGVFGHACKRKGFDRFVKLARALPNKTFLWGGSLDALNLEGLGDCLDIAKSLQNVNLCGHVDPYYFYCSISTLLHLCREDPSPLTSWEAASLRIPQIAFSQDIGNPHIIAANGFLISGSYSENLLIETIELGLYKLLSPFVSPKFGSRTYKDFLDDIKNLLIPLIV